MTESRARYGWESDFPSFRNTPPTQVRERLQAFVTDASPEQVRAWSDSIPPLQREVSEVLLANTLAKNYSAILEYELPMESRRPDVVLLVGAGVMVIELKGKAIPSQADLDQAAAYARDLLCYHRECASRTVVPVLVPTRAQGYVSFEGGVHVAGPDALNRLIVDLTSGDTGPAIDRERFLAESAYCPLPTLVEAARELFRTGELRTIHRARAATDPAVEAITRIIHHAAATKTRHLILLTGVPGAGKTLVGLRTVHTHFWTTWLSRVLTANHPLLLFSKRQWTTCRSASVRAT
ncbi:MAG: DNA/RNA helicase domain-containing protein [Gemmatimonadaceae bacterium]